MILHWALIVVIIVNYSDAHAMIGKPKARRMTTGKPYTGNQADHIGFSTGSARKPAFSYIWMATGTSEYKYR